MPPGVEPARARDEPGADPERVVVECCAAGTPAVVTFLGAEAGLRAAFSSFRQERLELEMTDRTAALLPEGTVYHVSFLHRGRPVNFTAPLRGQREDDGRVCIRMNVPGAITSEGLRSSFRIPGGPGNRAVDLVGDDGIAWPAELVNLSLTGMFLRFEADGPTLLPDQVVELSVQVADEHVRLSGVVRRVGPDGVGLFFPDAVSEAPENPIRCAVAALERDWHSRLRR